MRNFVGYDAQERIMPSLFIGYVEWPLGWALELSEDNNWILLFVPPTWEGGGRPVPVEVDLRPEIIVTEHQTAGVLCNHLPLFGLCVRLPERAPLIQAGLAYYESNLMPPADWQTLKEWEKTVTELGLDLQGTGYRNLQEAFHPVSFESAVRYAQKHAIGVLTAEGGVLPWPIEWDGPEAVRSFLREAWEEANAWRPEQRKSDLWLAYRAACATPLGAVIYENSD